MTSHWSPAEKRVINRWEAIFSTLRAEPRRQLIHSLRTVGPKQSIPLPQSAARPSADAVDESLKLDLIHHHLPLLEANEFITWEQTPFQATQGPRFDEISFVIESIERNAVAMPESLAPESYEPLRHSSIESAD